MQKRYIFIIFLLAAIVLALLLLPKVFYCVNDDGCKIKMSSKDCHNIHPKALLLEAISSERYITADELSSVIIGEDPSYQLVDIRSNEQFEKYSLPNAVNLPFDTVMDEKNETFFDTDDYKVILFSNGTVMADQIWSLLRRKGFKNVMVLKGGLNEFYQKILNPQKPADTDPKEAFALYDFRKAAGPYFGLPNPEEYTPQLEVEPVKPIAKPIIKNTNTKKSVSVKAKPVPPVKEDEGC